ncbi:MAG: DUF3341 domain-containing protein [Gemmatimonadetes bacterium]|nr:MAG: DUF3341 domain-containing protein [Gemmatimonadota bacterium]
MSERVAGVIAQFEDPAALLKAAERVRDEGYKKFDCHSPFPIHGMDQAMGERRSPLGWIVGGIAVIATLAGAGMQWWTNGVDYQFVISGKPFVSYQAYLPVTFAVAVLTSAFVSTFGMMALNGLPRWHHPLFESEQFKKVTDDGFLVSIEATDRKFNVEQTSAFLELIGGTNVEVITCD